MFKIHDSRKNWKCTEWHQNGLKPLVLKSLCTPPSPLPPQGLNFGLFRNTARRFRDTRMPKVKNAPNDLEWPLPLKFKSFLYAVSTYPRGGKASNVWSVSFYNQAFSIFKVKAVENRKYNEWLQNEIRDVIVQSTLYGLSTYSGSPYFTPTSLYFADTRLSTRGAGDFTISVNWRPSVLWMFWKVLDRICYLR